MESVPAIARAKGWPQLANLLQYWFSRPGFALRNTKTPSESDPYDDTTVKMEWVNSFARAKIASSTLMSRRYLFKNGVKRELVKMLKNKPDGRFGEDWVNEKDPRRRHKYHATHIFMPGNLLNLDGLDGALHDFHLYVILGGCKHWTSIDVDRAAVYVKDSFDFNGDQPLGFWAPPATVSALSFELPGGHLLSNSDFRSYRSRTGMGGDFFVFSDLEKWQIPKIEFNLR